MIAPRISRAGTADMDAVMAIMAEAFDPAFGEAWTRGQCLGMLGLPNVWLLLAMLDGETRASGFALARRTLDEAELLLIAVRTSARGQGLGRTLIEATAEEARRQGAKRLMLEVRATNPPRLLPGHERPAQRCPDPGARASVSARDAVRVAASHGSGTR